MTVLKLSAVALLGAVALLAGSNANIYGNAFGDPKAPVTIEVFSDFQCPGCKAFHDAEFQRILTDYVIPGKVYVVYRYLPLASHPYGRICAEYVCAAARIGQYKKVADVFFAQQSTIAALGNVEDVAASVLTPAEMKSVKALLKNPEVQRAIQTDVDLAPQVPVATTPTLWVTHAGKSQSVSWPLNYMLFKSYIDTLLKK